MVQTEKIALPYAASFIEWWKMAGVNYQVDEHPLYWLQENDKTAAMPNPAQTHTTPEIKRIESLIWPQSLPQLIADLGIGGELPGNKYGGKSAMPVGDVGSKLMIISDLPDNEDIESGVLGQGPSGKLLQYMIAATGQKLSDCYFTALAHSRPAAGDIPDADLPALNEFALHQMKIIKPQRVLILGSVACQALLNAELMTARGNLHYLNHDGQKVSVIITFHPRTLLARPILKAQAWKDLQMLNFKDAL